MDGWSINEKKMLSLVKKEELTMEIKVLGPGCARCEQVENLIREVLTETGVEATVDKVKDFKQIASYGVFGTPAVVINGKVKCVGKIPKKEDIKTWIGK
jgi:small redox-active disulfide protein 2